MQQIAGRGDSHGPYADEGPGVVMWLGLIEKATVLKVKRNG